jgi:hypothetical protein
MARLPNRIAGSELIEFLEFGVLRCRRVSVLRLCQKPIRTVPNHDR